MTCAFSGFIISSDDSSSSRLFRLTSFPLRKTARFGQKAFITVRTANKSSMKKTSHSPTSHASSSVDIFIETFFSILGCFHHFIRDIVTYILYFWDYLHHKVHPLNSFPRILSKRRATIKLNDDFFRDWFIASDWFDSFCVFLESSFWFVSSNSLVIFGSIISSHFPQKKFGVMAYF